MSTSLQKLNKPISENVRRNGREPGMHSAARNPPGSPLPNMAPAASLVALQRVMQCRQTPNVAMDRSTEKAPLQREDGAGHAPTTGTGLPTALKTGMEKLSGVSLDDVKVHYHSDKPKEVQALAYTQGSEIHVASGQEQHLAHEAWHAVQQKQGRVQATTQLKGLGLNDDSALEAEADVMGERALETARNPSTSISAFHGGVWGAGRRRRPEAPNVHPGQQVQPPMQCATDTQAASTGQTIMQRQIDARMPTRWYRGANGSNSAIVNGLIAAYNELAPEETQKRGEKLKEITIALKKCQKNEAKDAKATEIRTQVAREWTTLVDMSNRNLAPADLADLTAEQLAADPDAASGAVDVKKNLYNIEAVGAAAVTTYANEGGEHVPTREERNTALYRPAAGGASLYHATKTVNEESILRTGLDPGRGGSAGAMGTAGEFNAPNYIYLGHSEKAAFDFVRNFDGFDGVAITVLKVDLPQNALLVVDPDLKGSAVRTTRRIPPEQLSVAGRYDARHKKIPSS